MTIMTLNSATVSQSRQAGGDRGFTLLEMLVVISVIVVLIGLLLPVISKARRYSQQVACTASLRDIGAGWIMYRQTNPNAFPIAVTFPSANPAPAGEKTIMAALNRQITVAGAWRCAGDDRDYFARYATSYEYWPGIALAIDLNNAVLLAGFAKHNPAIVPVLGDAEAFHPNRSTTGRMALYCDGHVDWFVAPLNVN